MNAATNGRVVGFLFSKTGADLPFSYSEAWSRAQELVLDLVPRASMFERLGPLSGRIADGLFLAAFLVA